MSLLQEEQIALKLCLILGAILYYIHGFCFFKLLLYIGSKELITTYTLTINFYYTLYRELTIVWTFSVFTTRGTDCVCVTFTITSAVSNLIRAYSGYIYHAWSSNKLMGIYMGDLILGIVRFLLL